MNILNCRVDDRLVHGCVATMWVPKLNVERVICIDDESANNQMLKNALRLATPNGVFLSVLTHEKAISNLQDDRYQNQPIMIVSKSPRTFLLLLDNNIDIKAVTMGNLGNVSKTSDSIVVSRYITVNDNDADAIEQLHLRGVELEARLQPSDDVVNNFYEAMVDKRKKAKKEEK